MTTETHHYMEYEVQLSEYAGGWQAAIYPTKPGMAAIDWETKPIWAANIMGALTLAKQHINKALGSTGI